MTNTPRTFTSKDGTSIACHLSGSGPPLVLVHGTTADHTRWAPVLPELGERYTVYAMDRRGRGASGDAPAYALEREVEDVVAVVKGIGGRVALLGHSYGALCALEALPHMRELAHLILYEPPIPVGLPIQPDGIVERLQALLDAGDRDAVVTTFLRELPRLPEPQLDVLRRAPAWPARVAAAHTVVRELLAQGAYVFDPTRFRGQNDHTLLVLGGASPPFFRAALEAVHAALPSSRIAILPGEQHAAMDTGTNLFLNDVLGFLAE